MKKRFPALFLALALCLGLTAPVSAAGKAAGLTAFTDVKQYAEGTFQDVTAPAWYAASVKTVYNKGIMDGVGGGRFAPGETMSWAQAVTIAARLHAAYCGKAIPEAEGAWYAKYLDYARDNDLLPAICPEGGAVGSSDITREGLAVLFRSVLEEKDLPAVNDQAIPDLDKVRPEYQDAVSKMFAAGIFTGKNGLFDPDSKATRAEVATIVARLLCPGQRVSHDSRQNPCMADQMGNFYNYFGSAENLPVRIGDTVYYWHTHFDPDDTENLNTITDILARTDEGRVRTVYTADHIWRLSAGPDGMLYFWQGKTLRRMDPETGKAEDVYSSPDGAGIYLFYDGRIYLLLSDGVGLEQIVCLENGTAKKLVGGIYRRSTSVDRSFYAFGGKLYYIDLTKLDSNFEKIGSDRLCALDLETGKIDSVDIDIVGGNTIAYQGGTAWVLEYTNGNAPYVLKRFSLAMPEMAETVTTYSGSEYESGQLWNSPKLFANGAQLYMYDSFARKVWTVAPSGETKVLATATATDTLPCFGITSQGIFASTSSLTTKGEIITPDGRHIPYGRFLGVPYYLEGSNKLTATDNQASWEVGEVESPGYVNCRLVRAYVPEEGGVAVEVDILNDTDSRISIYNVALQLTEGAADWWFEFDRELLDAGKSKVFTFVFPEGYVSGLEDMADVRLEWYGARGAQV